MSKTKHLSNDYIAKPLPHGKVNIIYVVGEKEKWGFILTRAELHKLNEAIKEWDSEKA